MLGRLQAARATPTEREHNTMGLALRDGQPAAIVTVLTSAARTATVSSLTKHGDDYRGAHIIIDATAAADTPSVVFTIEGFDTLSGKYYVLLTSAAITGTGTTILTLYPGVTVAANVAVSNALPPLWRVTATHADTDSLTYSVGANLLP